MHDKIARRQMINHISTGFMDSFFYGQLSFFPPLSGKMKFLYNLLCLSVYIAKGTYMYVRAIS